MDKIIKINLGGSLFHIDEEAYKILRRYLQDIDDRFKNTGAAPKQLKIWSCVWQRYLIPREPLQQSFRLKMLKP